MGDLDRRRVLQTVSSPRRMKHQMLTSRRLGYHLFEHDIYTAHTKMRNPLISYAEMTLPTPACRELWLARSPEAWQTRLLSLSEEFECRSVSVRDLLADATLLRRLSRYIDTRLARNHYLYGLASQVWEYHQQSIVSLSPLSSDADPSAKLCLQLRHKSL